MKTSNKTIYVAKVRCLSDVVLVCIRSVPLSRHKQKADLLMMRTAVPFIGLHTAILKIMNISMTNDCKDCTPVLQQVIFSLEVHAF